MQKHLVNFQEFLHSFDKMEVGEENIAYYTIYANKPIIFDFATDKFCIVFTAKVNGKAQIRIMRFETFFDAAWNLMKHYYTVPKEEISENDRLVWLRQNMPASELISAGA